MLRTRKQQQQQQRSASLTENVFDSKCERFLGTCEEAAVCSGAVSRLG